MIGHHNSIKLISSSVQKSSWQIASNLLQNIVTTVITKKLQLFGYQLSYEKNIAGFYIYCCHVHFQLTFSLPFQSHKKDFPVKSHIIRMSDWGKRQFLQYPL